MYPIRNLASLNIAFFLSLGIGIASVYPIPFYFAILVFFSCIVLALLGVLALYKLHYSFDRRSLHLKPLIYLTAFFLGYLLYLLQLPAYQAKHFMQFYKEDAKQYLRVEISEVLRTTNYYQQYLAEVQQVNQEATHGRMLLRSPLKDSLKTFFPGQQLLIMSSIQAINAPDNPFEIDMRNHYRSLGLFYKTRLSKTMLLIASKPKRSWIWRNEALLALEKTILDTNSKFLIQAMVLGYREEWSVERKAKYADAGVAHLLAISGLHVGILFAVLHWIALPLQRIWKTKLPVYLFCLGVLWVYAWFTGMSASVTRSASMLSFFILSIIIGRPAPPLHTLASSYIVLLLIKPAWLFHIGFQMSYTAVLFILWAFPRFVSLWQPKKVILRRGWYLLLVTLIAQLGVLPWTLYYYGKFPGLFLLSNLILLSLLSLLLIGGALLLILAVIGMYEIWLFSAYNFINQQIEAYIEWAALQENWILVVNRPNLLVTFGLFALIIQGINLLWQSSYPQARNLAIACFLFISLLSFYKLENNKEEVWLLVQYGESLIMHKSPSQIRLFASHKEIQNTYLWSNLKNNYPKSNIQLQSFPEVFRIDQEIYLRIGANYSYSPSFTKARVLLLQQSFPQDLELILTQLNPKLVIADASSYPSRVEEWKDICLKRKTPFLSTSEKGAILLSALNLRK